MNIKITKKEHSRLQEWKIEEHIFGSKLYGTNNENSDEDILVLYSLPVDWEENTNYIPLKHCLQYDDVENNKQYVYVTSKQFCTLLYEGDNTIFSDIILFNKQLPNSYTTLTTYKIIKCYLGLAKRDLKEKTLKKLQHAERGLYIADCLLSKVPPLKEDIIALHNSPRTRERLILEEESLRRQLNEMFKKDEIKFYPELFSDDELLNKLVNANNIKEFKYD